MRWIMLVVFMGFCLWLLIGCAARQPKVSIYDGSTFPAKTCEVRHGKVVK